MAEEVTHAVRAHSAVLDGEICCLEPDGRPHFEKLLFRREWPPSMCSTSTAEGRHELFERHRSEYEGHRRIAIRTDLVLA